MIRLILRTVTLLLLPAVCSAQHPHRPADTSFKTERYSLDRDFRAQAVPEAAKSDDGKSVRRFRIDDAGIAEAVKLLVAAAPGNFKSVRVESSKQADEIFGGTSYDGRVVIDGGLLAARASVEMEDGLYVYKLNIPLLRSGGKDAATTQVKGFLGVLPPVLGSNASVGKPSEYAGIIHHDVTAGDERPAIRLEQIGSNVAIYIYPKASQLAKK
jgi:hypothetical protein